MASGFDGAVTLHLCGEPRRLSFTWGALAELRSAFGADFQSRVNDALESFDPLVLAKVVSIGTGVQERDILENSPGVFPTIKAVYDAFNLAYHGPDGAPKKKAESERPLGARARNAAKAILLKLLSMLG